MELCFTFAKHIFQGTNVLEFKIKILVISTDLLEVTRGIKLPVAILSGTWDPPPLYIGQIDVA